MEKTHWKKLNNPDYIGAYELMKGSEPIELTVTMEKVSQRQVKGADGKNDMCLVADLKGFKPFIINSTNAKTITKLMGTPYIEDWVGKQIILTVRKVKAFGDIVDALRVKDTLPVAKLPELKQTDTVNFNKVVEAIKNGYDIATVRTRWSVSKEVETILFSKANETV